MQLSDGLLSTFAVGKLLYQPPPESEGARVNSLSFHRVEDRLVTATDDDGIRLYDTARGTETHMPTAQAGEPVWSRKYGVANICFTHDPYSVLYSSNKGSDHAWRYHDLIANKYVRYFRGHTGRVTTLCQSPKTDQVLSAAEDKQVRLWDLRSGVCTAMLQAPGLPTVAFDEQGLVFCVGAESGLIKLYDARNYASGPFAAFVVAEERNSAAVFASFRFSLDGKSLLAVVEGRIYVLDSFEGTTLRKVESGVRDGGTALEACLTADGRYIISGCGDRAIRVWNVQSGEEVAKWVAHADVPACVKFSPKKMMVASACRSVALWIPDLARQ